MDNEEEDRMEDVIGNENIEPVDTSTQKIESLLVAGYFIIIKAELLQLYTFLESMIDSVLNDFLIGKKPEASGVREAGGARGARGLKKYMQGPDIRVYQTDSTEEDITVDHAHSSEGDTTDGKEIKKSFWSKKKFLIPAISVISLLFIALTLGVSLYFGLYHGKTYSKGDYCKV